MRCHAIVDPQEVHPTREQDKNHSKTSVLEFTAVAGPHPVPLYGYSYEREGCWKELDDTHGDWLKRKY